MRGKKVKELRRAARLAARELGRDSFPTGAFRRLKEAVKVSRRERACCPVLPLSREEKQAMRKATYPSWTARDEVAGVSLKEAYDEAKGEDAGV